MLQREATPLHCFAQAGHLEIVSLLIEAQADIEAQDLVRCLTSYEHSTHCTVARHTTTQCCQPGLL